jgi:hypothetical protein
MAGMTLRNRPALRYPRKAAGLVESTVRKTRWHNRRPNMDAQTPAPNSADTHAAPAVRVIASPKSWIVGDAATQLQRVAQLPGAVQVVGMPDLHPGKGAPIGAVVATRGVLYPHLAGNDIGCGMGLWHTDLSSRRLKLDRWIRKPKLLAIACSPRSGIRGTWQKMIVGWSGLPDSARHSHRFRCFAACGFGAPPLLRATNYTPPHAKV